MLVSVGLAGSIAAADRHTAAQAQPVTTTKTVAPSRNHPGARTAAQLTVGGDPKAGTPAVTLPDAATVQSRRDAQRPPSGARKLDARPSEAKIVLEPSNFVPPASEIPHGFDASKSKEAAADRTENSKVYDNPDGTRTRRIYSGPVHCKDESGSWKDIDVSLEPGSNGKVKTKANRFGLQLAKDASDPFLGTLEIGSTHSVAYGVEGAQKVAGSVKGSAVAFKGVRAGADLEITATPRGLKEAIVLASKSSPRRYVFPLVLKGLTPSIDAAGGVSFKDAGGLVLARVPHGSMDDSTGGGPGVGASSSGVTYSLVARPGGKTALQVDLDGAWLDDPARVYPVRVDPSLYVGSDSDDTFITSGKVADNSASSNLQVGPYTVNGVTYRSVSYLHFSNVYQLHLENILGALLQLYNNWSGVPLVGTCTARGVSVWRVTQAWSGSSMTGFPGASYDANLANRAGWSSFAHIGSQGSCPSSWENFDLTNLVRWWEQNGSQNFGVALTVDPGSESDGLAYKQFNSSNNTNVPFININYTPYNASYAPDAQFTTNPTNNAPGTIYVNVTNTSGHPWAANGNIRLSYHIYNPATNAEIVHDGIRTLLPQTVAPGQTVRLLAKVQNLVPGNYVIGWDMVDEGTAWFSAEQVPIRSQNLTVSNVAPYASSVVGPANGAGVATTAPTLSVTGTDPDAWPGSSLQYWFRACTDSNAETGTCWNSGWQTSPSWTLPSGQLNWQTKYYWHTYVSDGITQTNPAWTSAFTTVVPSPATASAHFGWDPYAATAAGVNLTNNNFTTGATDAGLEGAGPAVDVSRTYNSLDSRTTTPFGTGWSSPFDMSVSTTSTTATVTYPDGRQENFGKNPSGTFAAQGGFYSSFQSVSGGFTMSDKSGTNYSFGSNGKLASIADAEGHAVTFAYDGSGNLSTVTKAASGRKLTFAWSGGHVSSVATDPVTSGGSPLVWKYYYSGNQLLQVCDPRNNAQGGGCTTYAYGGVGSRLSSIMPPANRGSDQLHYAADGTVDWRQDRAGNKWTYATSTVSGQRHVKVTDPRGNTVESVFDSLGRLVSRIDALGKTRTFGFGAEGFLASVVDENGNQTTYKTDNRGNVIERTTSAAAGVTATTYYSYFSGAPGDPRNDRLVAVRDPRSSSASDNTYLTTFTYNTSGDLVSRKSPATADLPSGSTSSWTYTTGAEPAVGSTGTMPAGLIRTEVAPAGGTRTFSYDNRGDLRRTVDRVGLQTDLTYDGLGRMLTGTETSNSYPSGLTTSYTYDLLGSVLTATEPRVRNVVDGLNHGRVTTYTYDADENVTSMALSDSTANQATRTTTFTYDAQDRPTSVKDPANGTVTTTYDANGNVATVTDQNGTVTASNYTARDELSSTVLKAFVDDPITPGSPRDVTLASYTYDPAGRLATSVDELGRTTAYSYFNDDRLMKTVLRGFHDPGGATRDVVLDQRAYDKAGNVTSVTSDFGTGQQRTVTYAFDAANRLASSTFNPTGLNRKTTYAYDANGNVLTKTLSDATRSEQTRSTYDAADRVLTTTVKNDATPDLVTTLVRDQRGLVTASTDPRGYVAGGAPNPAYTTNYAYDEARRTKSVILPSVATESNGGTPAAARPETDLGYDTFGDATQQRDPNGKLTTQSFDLLGRRSAVTLPVYTTPTGTVINAKEQYTYDPTGNVKTAVDRRGQTTSFDYDKRNRVVRQTDPKLAALPAAGVTRTAYDDAGNVTSTVDPTGARKEATYGDRNQMATSTTVVRSGATSTRYVTAYTYDDLGDLTTVTSPLNELTSITYNAAQEPISVRDPSGNATTLVRDVAGRLIKSTDPLGRATSATFDQAGRQTALIRSGAAGGILSTTSFAYDAAGNQTSTTTPAGWTTNRAYDAANRITTMTEPVSAGTSITTSIGYDTAGNPTRTTDGRNNNVITSYTPWNTELSRIEPATTAYPNASDRTFTTTYDAGGLPVRIDEPGGLARARTYDEMGNLSSETGSGATTATRTLGYDLDGRITSAGHPSATEQFTYDDRGLVTAATGGAGSSSFAYDADGRLTSRTDAAGTATFGWDPRGLLSSATDPITGTTQRYAYDAAGQPATLNYGTNAAARTYGFDELGRLSSEAVTQKPVTSTAATDVYVDGSSDTWIDTPNAAKFNVPGDLDLRIDVAPDQWVSGFWMGLITKANVASGDFSYSFEISDDGHLALAWSPDGNAFNESYSTALPPGTDGSPLWLRATLKANNGAGGTDVKFYTSTDGSTWTQLGATVTTPGTTSIQNTSSPVSIGAYGPGSWDWLVGKIVAAEIRNGIGGTSTASFKSSELNTTTPSPYTDSTATPWTFHGTGWNLDVTSTPAPPPSYNLNYGYDADNNLTTKTLSSPFAIAGLGTNTYTYDRAERLVSWAPPGAPAVTYTYDNSGNRTQAGTQTYTYDQRNRLVSETGSNPASATYAYTARGTLSSRTVGATVTPSTFDAFDRQLTSGSDTFQYDALDRAAKRNSTVFTYAGISDAVVNDGTFTYSRTPGGAAMALAKSTTKLAVSADRHGDVINTLNPTTGAVADSKAYDPWGSVTAQTGTTGPSIGYQGNWTDPNSSRVDMGARWYLPGQATFATRDSLTLPVTGTASLNRYTYADTNPLANADPSGHYAVPVPLPPLPLPTWLGGAAAGTGAAAGGAAVGAGAAAAGGAVVLVGAGVYFVATAPAAGDPNECAHLADCQDGGMVLAPAIDVIYQLNAMQTANRAFTQDLNTSTRFCTACTLGRGTGTVSTPVRRPVGGTTAGNGKAGTATKQKAAPPLALSPLSPIFGTTIITAVQGPTLGMFLQPESIASVIARATPLAAAPEMSAATTVIPQAVDPGASTGSAGAFGPLGSTWTSSTLVDQRLPWSTGLDQTVAGLITKTGEPPTGPQQPNPRPIPLPGPWKSRTQPSDDCEDWDFQAWRLDNPDANHSCVYATDWRNSARGRSTAAIREGLPALRQAYVNDVKSIGDVAAEWQRAGASPEEVAREAWADRRALGIQYKNLTPPDMLERITARNLAKHGDPLGPTIDFLRDVKGYSWEQIIERARTPGGKDLGF
ncbi:MAG: DNRLRE domain-containing protein [Acidimicrobiia bacterium]